MDKRTLKICYSAICLALAIVLPLATGQLRAIGNSLCPMHLPVLLCGFLCGWPYGLAVGFIAPLLRSAIFGMPVLFPSGIGMAFELAAYGLFAGLFYRYFPKKPGYLYVSLLLSMLLGRIVWGIVRFMLAGFQYSKFPFSLFLANGFTGAVPGMLIQIILIPPILLALKKANLFPDERN